MRKIISVCAIAIITVLSSNPALADGNKSPKDPWERFSFSMGGFMTFLNSDFRIGSGVGVTINVEEALDLDAKAKVFRADVLYRFGKSRRHRVDFGYFHILRSSTKSLETELEIGDHTFPIGTVVDSHFNIKFIKGAYNYSIFQDDRIDLAVSAGLYVAPIDIGISAAGIGSEETNLTAPLPVFGLRLDVAITPKLFLKPRIDFFYMEIDKFKGGLTNSVIAVEYNIWEYVGLGLAFESLRMNFQAEGKDYPNIDFAGSVAFDYFGLNLYAKIYF